MGWNHTNNSIFRWIRLWMMNGIPKLQMRGLAMLPPKPLPPSDSDCCDSACDLCVKDIYEQELKIWEKECNNILLGQAAKSSLSPETYSKCQLLDITQVNHNSVIYTFDSKGYVEIKPGQHLILRELIESSMITRQYTPIAVPTPLQFTFKILIKHYANGILTPHIKSQWKVGDDVEWRGPHGMFHHQPNKYMKYIMLAAGTGIAPMLSICQHIVQDDSDITSLRLLYAVQTYEDILLASELKQLSRHWNFTYKTFLSQDGNADNKKGYGESVANGRISQTDISSELTNPRSTRVLICGTREFDRAMLKYCDKLEVPPENIFKF